MGHVLKRVVALAVPCLLLLSGCGVAGTEFNPGVAARVGDETVTTDEVDDLAAEFCSAVEDQVAASGDKVPLGRYKSGIAAQLAMESAADQLADRYGVTPSQGYQTQIGTIKQQGTDLGLTGDDLDVFVDVQSSQPRVIDLLTQIGAIELEAEGEEEPTVDFQQARGQDELDAWIKREGLTFDPRYGLQMVDGVPQNKDTDVTFAAGDIAKGGLPGADTDASYVASLPASATCG